jgi:predicted dehydrogenase
VDKIKVVHVGLGGWGGNWATHVLPFHPDIEPVGYVEIVGDKRTDFADRLKQPIGMFHERLDDALNAGPVDAVTIAVPIALHEPLTRQALEAGKHVIIEKPFTQTMAEARGVVELARAKGLILGVSQNYRFYPAAQAVAGFARSGMFGKLLGGKLDFRRNNILARVGTGNTNWPSPMIADMAVHHYDLMRMIIGADPIEVSARSWNPPNSPYREDACAAMTLSFPDSVSISYRGSWVDAAQQTPWSGEWQLDFERASLFWTGRGAEPYPTARDRVQIKRMHDELEEVPLPPYPLFDRAGVLHALAETIRTGVEPQFFPSGGSNLGTLATIEAALKSAAHGGAAVRLDEID